MFLKIRSLAAVSGRKLLAAVVIFAVGAGAGSAIGPAGSSQHGARVLGLASGTAGPGYRAAHPAEILRVLDGDTFEARVRVWPGLDITTKVRLRGIDAPELRAHCEDERVQAEAG